MREVIVIRIVKIIVWSIILGIILIPFFNHLIYCFKSEKYLLLIAGSIVPPVGWFYGLGNLIGLW